MKLQKGLMLGLGTAAGLMLLSGVGLAQEAAPAAADAAAAAAPVVLDKADTAWMLTSTALVLLMTIPGLALFYAGMVRKKNILATMMQSFGITALVTVLWAVLGYSLAFTDGTAWIGDFSRAMLSGVTTDPANLFPGSTIPESVGVMFQMTFAIITPGLIVGSLADRVKFSGLMLFIALWSLLVYSPICHWVWASTGWLNKAGVLDFAGGTVVHINAGIAGLVGCLYIGKRKGFGTENFAPHNVAYALIGASLLWVGWFGFNAGSATSAGTLAGSAFFVTNTATAVAGLVWAIIEYIHHKKPTVIGACTGAVAGLVAITPASGYVDATGAIVIGVVVAIVCYMAVAFLKKAIGYDDALDTFGVHAVGGMTGALLTGVFCNPDIGTYFSGQAVAGVFYSGNWTQLGIQAVSVLVAVVLAIVGTIISYGIARIFTKMRVEPQEEITGLDQSLLGEKQGDR